MGVKFLRQIMQKDGKEYFDKIVAKNEKLREAEREFLKARKEVAASCDMVSAR